MKSGVDCVLCRGSLRIRDGEKAENLSRSQHGCSLVLRLQSSYFIGIFASKSKTSQRFGQGAKPAEIQINQLPCTLESFSRAGFFESVLVEEEQFGYDVY